MRVYSFFPSSSTISPSTTLGWILPSRIPCRILLGPLQNRPRRAPNLTQLSDAVMATWDAILDEELGVLVQEMRDRRQAVIDAEGGHIPY